MASHQHQGIDGAIAASMVDLTPTAMPSVTSAEKASPLKSATEAQSANTSTSSLKHGAVEFDRDEYSSLKARTWDRR